MEVTARDNVSVFGEHYWIVYDRAEFAGEHRLGMCNGVADGPMHLRGATEAVGILDLVAEIIVVRGRDLGSIKEIADPLCGPDLSRVRAQFVDPFLEWPIGSEHRFDGQRTRSIIRIDKKARTMDREAPHRKHPLGAIEQAQPLLCLEHKRGDSVLLEHRQRRNLLTIIGKDEPFADDW